MENVGQIHGFWQNHRNQQIDSIEDILWILILLHAKVNAVFLTLYVLIFKLRFLVSTFFRNNVFTIPNTCCITAS